MAHMEQQMLEIARTTVSTTLAMRKQMLLGMPRFGSELRSEPEPSQTGPKFGPGFGVGAEPDQRSCPGFRGGPNLAELFRTGSEPQTRRSPHRCHPARCVVVALCATPLLPCTPHRRHPVHHVIVALHPMSLSPCAPRRHFPARRIKVWFANLRT